MKKILLLFIACVTLNEISLAQKSWNQKADFPGVARNSAIAFAVNGKGYLGLGQNANGTKQYDFYEYDPSNNTWTKKSNYPGGGSHTTCAFAINGKGYVCLGANSSGVGQVDLWEYTPSTDNWSKKANFPGTGRYGASWFVINDTAFIMTGTAGGTPYLSDVWMYVPATNTWTQKANFPGGSRTHGAAFTINGVAYFGTGIKNSTTATKDVWKYDKSKDTWTSIADYPLGAITGAIGFEVNKAGYLGTGYNLTNVLKDIYEYIPTSNTWKKLDSIPSSQSVRGGSVSFLINKSIYISTGYSSVSSTVSSLTDLWSYTPKTNCSTNIITQPNNKSFNLNDTAKFSVLSGDTGASYKWQVYSGTTYNDLSDGGQIIGSKTKLLKISTVKYSTNNNQKFRCIATGKTCADTSLTVTLSVICPGIISTDPQSTSKNNGDNVVFITKPKYSGSAIIWQANDGSGFKTLSEAGQFSGVNKDTLKVSELQYFNNNYKFRSLVTYQGCTANSAEALLTVSCKTIIISNPKDVSVYRGYNATFAIQYNDSGTSFQWKYKSGASFQNLSNAGIYSGIDKDTLKIQPVQMNLNKTLYKCILAYKGCKDSIPPVTLTVLCTPNILKQPITLSKYDGDNALFTVVSTSSSASYQWQNNLGTGFQNLSNSSKISGVYKDSLKISNLVLTDNNQYYRCIVNYDGCADTSVSAKLNVSCPTLIASQSSNTSARIGDNVKLVIVSMESKANLQWQTDLGFGYQNLSNAGQYNGTTNDTLTIINLTNSNNNQKFRCIITYGNCSETSNPISLSVTCPKSIISQAGNKTSTVGSSVNFHVISSMPNPIYKWQTDLGFGFQNLSNAGQFKGVNDDTLVINNLTLTNDNQTFRCLMSNGSCSDTSQTVTLTIKTTGFKNLDYNKGLIIYPNPANNEVIFEVSSDLLNNTFKIINQQGQIVFSDKLTANTTKIDIENLSKGIYILQTEPVITRTLIIKN